MSFRFILRSFFAVSISFAHAVHAAGGDTQPLIKEEGPDVSSSAVTQDSQSESPATAITEQPCALTEGEEVGDVVESSVRPEDSKSESLATAITEQPQTFFQRAVALSNHISNSPEIQYCICSVSSLGLPFVAAAYNCFAFKGLACWYCFVQAHCVCPLVVKTTQKCFSNPEKEKKCDSAKESSNIKYQPLT